MTAPDYWGDESVTFTTSWQAKLFEQISDVDAIAHDIRLQYLDSDQQAANIELSALDVNEKFHMQGDDVFAIHGEHDEIVGFLSLKFQEMEISDDHLQIYTNVDHIHILPEHETQYPTLSIVCMVAFVFGKHVKHYLAASEEAYKKVNITTSCETQESLRNDPEIESQYFHRIFKGQCKSPVMHNTQKHEMTLKHYFMLDGNVSR